MANTLAEFDEREGPSRAWRVCAAGLLSAALLLLLVALRPGPVLADGPNVVIEITPSTIAVPPEGHVEALVVVQNSSAQQIRGLRLSWFSDAAIDVTVDNSVEAFLQPFGSVSWPITVSMAEEGSVAGTLHIRVDYGWDGEGGDTPGLELASAPISARQPDSALEVADARVETTLDAIDEHHPGTVYLVITNKSDVPIEVKDITVDLPEFLSHTPPDLGEGVSVAPRGTRAFPVEIRAGDTVTTGKHLVVLGATLEWERAGRIWTGEVIATHELGVGILGESDILTLVGVPSLLVLPGFLMLTTFGFLWRNAAPRKDFPLAARSPEFWTAAVALSAFAAVLYPYITGWLADRSRNYLQGYGLRDVVWVWIGSVLFGGLGYLVWMGGAVLVQWSVGRWAERHTPSSTDGPILELYKLHRQKLGIKLRSAEATIGGEKVRVFLLQPLAEGGDTIWVGPSIILEWTEEPAEMIYREVQEQLGEHGTAGALAKALERGQAAGALEVRWGRRGQLDRPREVKKADLVMVGQTVIVEEA
jgi:hypothetical protein